MSDAKKSFELQAQWQRRRADLTWPEKIRQAEAMREAILQLRANNPASATKLHDPESPAGSTSSLINQRRS
jgi:hypothetical protein